jgi:hypothetical protein
MQLSTKFALRKQGNRKAHPKRSIAEDERQQGSQCRVHVGTETSQPEALRQPD